MLKGNQKKLDKNKNNRIDKEDFELLRAGKKRGGVMKAKRGGGFRLAGKDFSERMKNVEKGLINKKTGKPTSMDAMRQLKGFKTGELPKEFNKRRMALAGAKEALKRTRIGKIALGVAGVGLAAKALLDKKRKEAKEKKKNKKMGGGMMKRYNKGGGADTGRMGEIKSKLGVATNQINRMKIPGRLTQRDKEALKEISKIKGRKFKPLSTTQRVLDALKSPKPVAKKMGGGMMQPAMPMYKKGTMIKARGGGLAKTKPTKMY